MATPEACLVLTTVPDDETGQRIAKALVEEGMAGCVQRLPIQSIYAWEGRVEEDAEYLLLIKTTFDLREAIERRLQQLSPYQVPEVVVFDAGRVAPAYAAWLATVCNGKHRQ